ncbi:putative acetyltransferase EpsM [Paenibacillus baekrokdamisoli]|uniref:Putative acetyltransferase EpsM n=1 Tax=Paenibacillus baekrokdamisoli TaxID=1712516 RepID=A0A3G9IL01_9BACL|nr:acetyltransferase [Paenibacillus baekrokdamisoli]MBB3067241.1 acetyltransferase EpsM [Paenibacillus baekrokdamisoli]BBH19570.1 putative acetyltransferase EpsM [Paenibacillus baekrokdamisoli]
MRNRPLIIVGGGGHGKVVMDIAEMMGDFSLLAIADDKFTTIQESNDILCGPTSIIGNLLEADQEALVIIAIGDNRSRFRMAERLDLPKERYAKLQHPGAHVSKHAIVAPGTVVMAGAVVNTTASIAAHAIINSGAVIEHDVVVGPFAHISPNAALAGAVTVGEGAHVGIGASVIPGVRIGKWSVLGAGAAAIRDVLDHLIAVGVPAKVIDRT